MFLWQSCAGYALAVLAFSVAGMGMFDPTIVLGAMAWLALVAIGLDPQPSSPGRDAGRSAKGVASMGLRRAIMTLAFAAAWTVLLWRWAAVMIEQDDYFVDIGRFDLLGAWVGLVLIGWHAFRLFGAPLLFVYAGALVYALTPEAVGGAGLDWTSLADRQWFSTDGAFGRPLQTVATTVLVFVLFGAVMTVSGAGETLLKLAFATTGRLAGGPAHAAILGSAFFGTMSGAAVANVASTGTFTIPLIKRAGFRPAFAGGIEAAASAGGQVMPPVMGVVAFIMADLTGIAYLTIVVAGLVPALLYYVSLALAVVVEARKRRIGVAIAAERQHITAADLIRSLSFLVPLATLVFALANGRTAQNAGFYALLAALPLCLALYPSFRRPGRWLVFLNEAGRLSAQLVVIVLAVGVIIGVVNMTGLGLSFAEAIRALSGDDLFIALLLVMMSCLLMGMGVPSVTAYLVLALVMAPAVEALGVSKLAAHLFIVYFGVLSVITPPVALASFVAAPIAGAGPTATSLEAVRLAVPGFIIPFAFVYHPELLLVEGFGLAGLLWSLVSFGLASWSVTTALMRFDRRRLALSECGARLGAAALLLVPIPWMSLAGAAIALVLLALHNRRGQIA